MKTLKHLSYLLIASLIFVSCSSDDDNNDIPEPVNEEEVITTITATLTPAGGGTAIVLQSQDLDGDGPNAPVVTVSGDLAANTSYSGSLDLLNETESPAESITEEIEEEALEHQFFFDVSNGLFDVAYDDVDADGNPVGLSFIVTTDATTGTEALTITLRHEPNKDASGVSAGDITNAGGETDIEVTFNVTVQ
ncbi:type 1 periplasmic binding fold superfamily protein [Mesoflavibacter profundi]|uniref:Type 1 periplasmic binding fold superfamily protein n=1 Tax=Mesoflavibacter profundi TaxID=2708110 RepID=A0ABT4RXX5_9FLAO|nr:type 1 periplasmic binding fold superfamily protein [Mesoflavibacter profundi]MDA0176673.1 type 1 periplasmic binding fold superfamily protein [Mesoflavibacter profundi]